MELADPSTRARLYVDDATFWTAGSAGHVGEVMRNGSRLTREFEEAWDWRLNMVKSRLFTSSATLCQRLRVTEEFRVGVEFQDLGVVATVGAARRAAVSHKRAKGAQGRLEMVKRLPLPFAAKCLFAQQAGTAAGMYGAGVGPPRQGDLKALRRAVRYAVVKGSS